MFVTHRNPLPSSSCLNHQRLTRGARLLSAIVWLCLLWCTATTTLAQTDEEYQTLKEQAFALFKEHRLTEALPLFEKLYAANPKDASVIEGLAFTTLASAQALKDADARKRTRLRARELALKAKELGDDSNLLKTMLDAIPEDGGEDTFSNRREIDEVMREGEAAFARGDFKQALASYERALQLDPRQYTAALFAGDVYFKQHQTEKAGEWFAKAIAINPDAETAYRYWGDALMMEGKMQEARDKFIAAIIAEPYDRRSWMGLIQWAEKNQVRLAHPAIKIPTSVSQGKGKDGKSETNITLDINSFGKKDGTSGWAFYGLARAVWMNEKFLKEYPNEKTYRHSLREETDALRGVIEAANNELKGSKDRSKLDPSIANLIKLNEAGVLEAYILLAMADQGIAQDYATYRQNHREQLRQYLTQFVAGGGK